MKNAKDTLWKFTIPLALIFILSNCGDQSQKPKQDTPKGPTPITVDMPKNIITLKQADALYANYSNYRSPIINQYETKERAPSEAFEVARFVDFDYKQLKDYLAYVDQEAEKAGVKEVTKLRLYFANYPNEDKFSDGKKVVHKRQNSIFLTPTMAINNGDYSFYIGENGKPKLIIDWKAEQLKDLNNPTKETNEASLVPNFFSSSAFNGQSLIYNRGNNGPPPHTEF